MISSDACTSIVSAKSPPSPNARLVHFEETPSARSAFERERQIKGWSREKKLQLIESTNAGWVDLAAGWFPKNTSSQRKNSSSRA